MLLKAHTAAGSSGVTVTGLCAMLISWFSMGWSDVHFFSDLQHIVSRVSNAQNSKALY